MNTPENPPLALKSTACAWQRDCETRIAQNPWAAVGIAAAAGLLFRPSLIAALLGVAFRIMRIGIRPLLLFVFVKKALEIAKSVRTPPPARAADEPLPPVGI